MSMRPQKIGFKIVIIFFYRENGVAATAERGRDGWEDGGGGEELLMEYGEMRVLDREECE